MNKSIAFIYGDNRQIFLANIFISKGFNVYTYNLSSPLLSPLCINCTSLSDAITSAKYIVFPFRIDCIPLIDLQKVIHLLHDKIIFGGCITDKILSLFTEHKLCFYDYFKIDYVAKLNAISTAEGSIYYAIGNSNITIHNSPTLVIGYGNCGSVLAHKLKNLGANVYVTSRNTISDVVAYTNSLKYINLQQLPLIINKFLFIFNTVPSIILDKQLLKKVNKNTVIIDIASSPF